MIGLTLFFDWVFGLFGLNSEEDEDIYDAMTYEELLKELRILEEADLLASNNSEKCSLVETLEKELVDDCKCCVRSGTVTSVFNESGIIDGTLHFDLRDAPEGLCVDDVVAYLAYRPTESDDWRVRKVYSTQERAWDMENAVTDNPSIPIDEPKETLYRSEIRQVTERRGREVILNNGEFRFSLDKVITQFAPVVGDFLFLDALVEQDTNKPDLAGEILDIERIRWVRYKVNTAKISKWFEHLGEGQIGNNCFFNKDVCVTGFTPTVGDEVSADMIESYQGSCSWRALAVTPTGNVTRSVKNLCKASASEMKDLCQDKYGISLNCYNFDFGKVQKNEMGKHITVTVTNSNNTSKVLMYGDFYMARGETQVSTVQPVKRTVLGPGETRSFSFCCRGKFLGASKEVFVFCFKGFKIGCIFNIVVIDPDLSLMDSPGPANMSEPKYYKGLSSTRGEKVLVGVKPIMPPKFIELRLGGYVIPERYWNAVFSPNNTLKCPADIQEVFEQLSPSLISELSIGNYRRRFQTLLYIEEIDATLKLQRFNMEQVMFRKAGPSKEFLALEVPGLAEKRPSLLVGDAIHASRPWKQDGLVFEGFVHKTLGKKVWLKFNADFHLSYSGEVYNVKFRFGRTALRRQHAAIDMALTHMGPQMLFPSKLNLKPPQLTLRDGINDDCPTGTQSDDPTQRKIIWVNPNLNCYQKEAVKNILKGEARPLPYIIFGPPGTGKTMTLVEVILQIFFLLPDSRMLVATPSNSSANLITERLLDSNILRPGDLVRFVGYHVFEEGSLPERLLPYSTTGNIKSMSGEEALPTPIGELGQTSNKSTLGRHRITIGTCIAMGQLCTMGFPRGHFTHVLVDEAGQATEPEIMVPLDFVHCSHGQVVLAGDPMQLGPVVGSPLALQYGLGESYLDRLIQRFPYERDLQGFPDTLGYDPRLVTRLIKNYRSLPEILDLPNSLFYDSSLEAQVSPTEGPVAEILSRFADHLPKRSAKYFAPPAILFHGVIGKNLQDNDSPSWFNPHETLLAMAYLNMCYSCGLDPDDVGIITPYRKQVQKMRWYYNRFDIPLPKIGSVEEFQGQERKVIILSTVRSCVELVESDITYSLGFVASRKRLNVAITRAQALLIIIGNPHVLSLDRDWRCTLQYCLDKEAYTGCDPPMICLPSVNSYGVEDNDSGLASLNSKENSD